MKDDPVGGGTTFIKMTRPEIGCIVRREALFARLDGLPGRIAAWIAGPPGAGKSTLAASYVDARNYQSAWYQVDPDGEDIATFFHYLGHAVRKLAGERLPVFDARYTGNVAGFSRHFFRQLFVRPAVPAALVLDGLPPLPADSALRIAIEAGLAQVPRHCCILVTSRAEPPATLARLRAGGELVCIGADELRIQPGELAAIANLRGRPLGPDAAQRVQERTQGWAAGVVLMLEHAKIAGSLAELPDAAPPQAVFDYLAGEIFERFPPETRQFLLRIACLQRTTAEAARRLSGEDKAGRLLLNLAHNDYFVREVVGNGERIYQLHPLLRDFLKNRASIELPEAIAPAALGQAAALLREAGQIEDAVALLIESRDWPALASLVCDLADTMLAQGRRETLASWLELLPPERLDAEPRLLLAFAASRLHTSPRTARHHFEKAYAGFRSAADREGMIASCRGLIDAIVFEFDDLAALDPWIGELIALCQAEPQAGPARSAGVSLSLIRALLLREPGHSALAASLRDGAAADASTAMARAMAALCQGDFAAAEAIFGGIVAHAGDPAGRLGFAIAAGLHHLLDGDYAKAREAARAGSALAEAEGVRVHDAWLTLLAGAAALGLKDLEGTEHALAALEGLQLRRGDRAVAHYLRSLLAVSENDTAREQREMKSALLLAGECGIPWFEWFARAGLAQALCGSDAHGAAAQVRGASALAERLASPLLAVPTLLAEAAAELKRDGEAAALAALAAALKLGREHGFRHIVGLRPSLVAALCAMALRHGIEPELARGLIRFGRLDPPAAALRLRQWPWAFAIATLGGFSLERETEPVEFSAKGPGRPVELLKVLVALGGLNVRADHLADALWPHVDADYAHKSFTATLHRLRRIFEDEEALILRDGRLSLNRSLFWLDTWALDQVLAEFDTHLRGLLPQAAAPALAGLLDEALALYAGPFLPDEAEQPAYIACREQVRARLLRVVTRVARHWEEAGEAETAADCYLRCIHADELCEAYYRNLMLCYQRHGATAEAVAIYEQLRTVLAARLKGSPSPETQAVHASLQERPRNPI